MTKWYEGFKRLKHCRWCGGSYKAHLPQDRDGFCSSAHKMAHARAFKKWKFRAKK